MGTRYLLCFYGFGCFWGLTCDFAGVLREYIGIAFTANLKSLSFQRNRLLAILAVICDKEPSTP
jgi:hypothetical protein